MAVEQYVLTNPALNYAQFLLRAILPTVLHVVTAIAAGYAVGSEFSRRSLRAWLKSAGGSPLTALVGKLAPLFAIFLMMMVVDAGIIHGVYEVPFRGDSLLMGASACLLLIAYLSLGSLFQLLTRNLALGMSVTAIICNPAFGFAGVGFPVLAMNGFARFWGALLPLRWYIQILFDQAVRGLPASDSARPFMILGALAIVLFGLAWLRLRAISATSISERSRAGARRASLRRRRRRSRHDRRIPPHPQRPWRLRPDRPRAASSTECFIRNPISASCCARSRSRSSIRITPSSAAIWSRL